MAVPPERAARGDTARLLASNAGVDPDDHHLYASLGCATENLLLAAKSHGFHGEAMYAADGGGRVVIDFVEGASGRDALVDAIARRQSTRAEFDGSEVSSALLAELERAASLSGVYVSILTERSKIAALAELVIAGNTRQMADPAFVSELKHWIRFNPRSALATGDGIYGAASGNPVLPTWLGSLMFDLTFRPKAENERYARQMNSAAGAIVISAEQAGPEHWVSAGRACQRFALHATALGLKASFINQPVEVPELRADLAALAGFPGKRPDIVMRFGRGPDLPKSPRRPVEAVIES